MTPIPDFPTPAQVLAVADLWDGLRKEVKTMLLTMTGQMGAYGPSVKWVDMQAASRIELVHRVYLFRDLINRVLP